MHGKPGPVCLALLLAVATPLALAAGDGHHAGHAKPATAVQKPWGIPADARSATRTVEVSMADTMRFTPADVTVKKGETIRFVVRNNGKVLHEMVLGTAQDLKEHAALMKKFPEMEHAEPHMAHVKPSTSGGRCHFICLVIQAKTPKISSE